MAAAAGDMNGEEFDEQEANEVGYKRPPRSTRFRKGHSGNPRGRPRDRRRDVPYDTTLGQMVTVREDGRERRVTAAEAFLMQLTQKGLAGDSASARASLAAIEEARARRGTSRDQEITYVILFGYGIGSALKAMNLGVKKNRFDKFKVRWELQPWIVEAAISRMGERRLSEKEQLEVWENTHTPEKVAWPDWWTCKG